ncbi:MULTISPECIES: hypothetical protein [Methylomonas]|uniref:Uncharacterized protein n=2 Tax=Methylomonas TaxID=416 RepID=A0A140E5F6_9GAMM|nr:MULTISPECIES: hypothetical protein [Methylomonas]AMK75630.1 hypothetical protein JT25_003865 [Methylomonas denitrificans]OAI02929.1 hypothetical protein A1342_03530 [Methylomonas methanica]TCV75241.1 hypothetical protein EDE11_1352 [Methylomonas methanica]
MQTGEEKLLTSDWGALSPHMIASFWEVDRDGNKKKGANTVVKAAVADEATLDLTLNWQSPFEQAGPETKAPTLFAMMQSGLASQMYDSLGFDQGESSSSKATRLLQQFEGRTGITQLNSVQVFNGMPPAKIPMTLLFRAWRDPVTEVEEPFNQLMEWALPIELAKDSTLLTNAIEAIRGSKDWIEAVLPSKAPTLLALHFKGRTFAPMVIESISQPLTSPTDKNGNFVELTVPITLATLAAIDRKYWQSIQQRK